MPKSLEYRQEDRYYPLPSSIRQLQTVTAERVMDVPLEGARPGMNLLDGLCFDRAGNLFICYKSQGRILKFDMASGQVKPFIQLPDNMRPSAVKVHKNGDIYVAVPESDRGSLLLVVAPEGTIRQEVQMPEDHAIADLVFSKNGGFYIADESGTLDDRSACVYYMEANRKRLHTVVNGGLIGVSGLVLTADERHLWFTEKGTATLHRLDLTDDRLHIKPAGSFEPYHFTGLDGPDSITIDTDGNLYVSVNGQGRFLVLNPNGVPIANILIPGREHGAMLKSTSLAIRPETYEAYMVAADTATARAALFRADVFANAYHDFQYLG